MSRLHITQNVGLELVELPPGEFMMGSLRGFPLELPVHRVRIGKPFLIGKFPVTQNEWTTVMGSNPSLFSGAGDLPVEGVSWDDANAFAEKLTARTRRRVRLPTEAEWEYACRAGVSEEFHFGASDERLTEYAWFDLNSNGRTHPVGTKKPNPWGLHDVSGNVWEWCEDVWHSDYEGAPRDGKPWLDAAERQPRRCLRGGAWNYDTFRCRSAYRSFECKDFSTDHFGLRVAMDL